MNDFLYVIICRAVSCSGVLTIMWPYYGDSIHMPSLDSHQANHDCDDDL